MESYTKERVLLLLSGGLDSVVLAHHLAKFEGKEVVGLFFSYNQIFAGKELAGGLGSIRALKSEGYSCSFHNIYLQGLLTPNPDGYNPSRNLIFLAHALRYAEQEGIKEIYAGFINQDEFGVNYPDCSVEFVEAFNAICRPFGVSFKAPFIDLYKYELYQLATMYGVDRDKLWSCNHPLINPDDGELIPCGKCGDCNRKALYNFPVTHLGDKEAFNKSYMEYPVTEARLLINNECNLSCSHCFYGFEDMFSKELSWEQWRILIDNCVKEGITNFHFAGKEPLINEKIFDLADYIRFNYPNITYDVVTNATTIVKYIDEIERAKFSRVCVSFDDFLSPVTRSFNEEEPIKLLIERDIPVEVFISLTSINYKRVCKSIEYLNSLGVKQFLIKPLYLTGHALDNPDIIPSADDILDFYLEFENLIIDGRAVLDLKSSHVSALLNYNVESFNEAINDITTYGYHDFDSIGITAELVCLKYMSQITITPDGYVLGCGTEVSNPNYHLSAVGNVLDTPIKELIKKGKEERINNTSKCSKEDSNCYLCKGECPHINYCYKLGCKV